MVRSQLCPSVAIKLLARTPLCKRVSCRVEFVGGKMTIMLASYGVP
jgi:hypothetical protein